MDKKTPATISMADEPEDPVAPSGGQTKWGRRILIGIAIIGGIGIFFVNHPKEVAVEMIPLPTVSLRCAGPEEQDWHKYMRSEMRLRGGKLEVPTSGCWTEWVALDPRRKVVLDPQGHLEMQLLFADGTESKPREDGPMLIWNLPPEEKNRPVGGVRYRNSSVQTVVVFVGPPR